MSAKHPIIAVTGSSGAGTTTARSVFESIFRRAGIEPVMIEGDSFHRHDREAMLREKRRAQIQRRVLTHFGPDGNLFEDLEALFREYGERGTGRYRRYIHDAQEAAIHGRPPGTFTEWEPIPPDTDLLFYEGLHGGIVTSKVDVARYVDLLIGMVPIINLEWIQKIHRDIHKRGYSTEAVMDTMLRRMYDYVHYIVPQFTSTHINFQRVPTVDTSNPFIARDIPSPDESFVVIRFRNPKEVDFPYLLRMIHGSFMSRRNTIVVPGGRMAMAMALILTPMVERFVARRGS